MTEAEFISLIDCRFPYGDDAEARRLIALGCEITPNAGFTVVHELVRVGRFDDAPRELRLGLLDEVARRLDHPLGPFVLDIARRLARDEPLSLPEVLAGMREVARFPGQMQALNVVYFSGADAWDEVEVIYEEIVARWRSEPGV